MLKQSADQSAVASARKTKRLAIFASGAGSNALRIIEYFKDDPATKISLIVCNRPSAGVLVHAQHHQIPTLLIEKDEFLNGSGYLDELVNADIDFIVLAGFLWKIPATILSRYAGRIINIHPALLPKFGGKGMYGARVHEAVLASGDKLSGITIHYVDGHYDNGDVIFQATCPVDQSDTPESLATKIHALEHEHFPRVIDECLDRLRAEEP